VLVCVVCVWVIRLSTSGLGRFMVFAAARFSFDICEFCSVGLICLCFCVLAICVCWVTLLVILVFALLVVGYVCCFGVL